MLKLSNWLRHEWPSLILGGVLVALIVNGVLAPKGPRDLLMLREGRANLESKRAELIAQKSELGTIVQNLRFNDRYIEHVIRRELGYARADELVYKFTGPGSSADARNQISNQLSGARKQSVITGLTLQLLSEFGVR
jgi:cell division protein FtsB